MGASNGAVSIQLAPADMPFQHKAAAAVGHRWGDVFSPLRILRDLVQTSEVSSGRPTALHHDFVGAGLRPSPTPSAGRSGWTPPAPGRFLPIVHSLLTQDCTCGIVEHAVAGRRHYVVSPSLEPALHPEPAFSFVEVAEARAGAWHVRREVRTATKPR